MLEITFDIYKPISNDTGEMCDIFIQTNVLIYYDIFAAINLILFWRH
jgi:hypothetical protein